MTAEQRRGRRIAMTAEERDVFLRGERTCRVGTVSAAGQPHVSPLWFVWTGEALWLYSIVRSRRYADLRSNPRISVVVDAGVDFFELHGVEVVGEAARVGEEPRTGEPCAELDDVERLFAEKYMGGPGDTLVYDARHAWLRIRPEKLVSWDFRKIAWRDAPQRVEPAGSDLRDQDGLL